MFSSFFWSTTSFVLHVQNGQVFPHNTPRLPPWSILTLPTDLTVRSCPLLSCRRIFATKHSAQLILLPLEELLSNLKYSQCADIN